MGKPCTLPESYKEMGQAIAEVPEDILDSPEKYAIYLAARNERHDPQSDFKFVADQVNERFSLEGKDKLSPTKLGKLLQHPEAAIEAIANSYQARQEAHRIPSSPSTATTQPEDRRIDYTHPGLARTMLVIAEFAAYMRGDEKSRDELAAVNRDVQGEAYENPLIRVAEIPGQAANYAADRHQRFETWVEEALTKDREAKQQVWGNLKDRVTTTWQSAVETDQKVKGALGSFFKEAQKLGQAVATRFQEDRQLLNTQDTPEKVALFERLKSAARE